LIVQNAFVPATQARHLHDELGGFHDQSSSASAFHRRRGGILHLDPMGTTAGAISGFLGIHL
jgi:hypothetical protein